jgi:alpha-N-arabinofuranosidase
MLDATVLVGDEAKGSVSPYLFGAFVEHLGTGLYGGVWDPATDAPRADVQAAVKAAGYTMIRYPGGCFADWYHWRDGVGPKHERPTYPEQFWTNVNYEPLEEILGSEHLREIHTLLGPPETNRVGTDEMLRYCVDCDIEPMFTANFGTGEPKEAAAWVEYTNRRPESVRPVRWWGIGNETFGGWELGHCAPDVFASRYREFAEAMRAVDPAIKLVAPGCLGGTGEYPDSWNRILMEEAGDMIDALSGHWYFPGPWVGRAWRDNEDDYLQAAIAPDRLGEAIDAMLAQIDAACGPERAVPLSLDEWNLWAHVDQLLNTNAPLCHAVFFAGCYHRMLERAARVKTGMISHLVNCMAPIQTRGERHFVTPSYLVTALYRRHCRRSAVGVTVDCEHIDVPPFADLPVSDEMLAGIVLGPGVESAPTAALIDAAATVDDAGATVFLTNRSLGEAARLTVHGLPEGASGRLRYITGPDPFARNDEARPDVLGYRDRAVDAGPDGSCIVELGPHTVAALALDAPGRGWDTPSTMS